MRISEQKTESLPGKRRRFQYSLRTLLVVMLLASIGMSWVAVRMQQARRQWEAVEEVRKLGGWTGYDDADRVPGRVRDFLEEHFIADVTAVHIRSPKTTDADVEVVKKFPRLQVLSLDSMEVTDAGLEHLKGLAELRELYIGCPKVTDAGLVHLKGLTQLDKLVLSGTKVTGEGADRLRCVLRKCNVGR